MMIFLYFFSDSKNQINRQQDHQKEHQTCRKGMKQGLVVVMIHMRSVLIQKSGHKKKRKKKFYRCDHDFSLSNGTDHSGKKQDQFKDQADFHKDHDDVLGFHTAFYETGHRINHSCSSSCSIRSPGFSARYGRISS